jgi:hypothetical protein
MLQPILGSFWALVAGSIILAAMLSLPVADQSPREAVAGLGGHTHVNCHCGTEGTIITTSTFETGWYECDCRCAWRYRDVGSSRIELQKVRACPSA